MPIDPRLVKWEGDEQQAPGIDPRLVKWEEQPQQLSAADKFIKGLRDPVDAGAQMLVNALPSSVVQAGDKLNNWIADKTGLVAKIPEGGAAQMIADQEKQYQDKRKASGETGIDWLRMGGNIVNPANLGLSRLLGGGMVAGGALGAASSPVSDNSGFWEEKAKQAGSGAIGAKVINSAMGGLARVVSPKASINPDVAMLQSEGVTPTIGQTLGGRWNALEEKLQSVPIMGDAISAARERSRQQFNNAAINRTVAPIGESVEGAGHDAVAQAGDMLSGAYKDAINKLKFVKFDQQFSDDLSQLQGMSQGLEPKWEGKFGKLISDKLGNRTSPNGSMLGDNYKSVLSDLETESNKYAGFKDSGARDYSSAVSQLRNLMQQQIGRGGNPEAAQAIKNADTGWANLVRVEGAAKAAMNSNGVFTPAQLNMAARQADTSVRDRATARGKALMQDLGGAGQNVIGNKVPNSFTTDRALIAGGALGSYLVNPAIPAGLLGGAALYTQPAQQVLGALVSKRPEIAKAIAEKMRESSSALIPAVPQISYGLINP